MTYEHKSTGITARESDTGLIEIRNRDGTTRLLTTCVADAVRAFVEAVQGR